jgi:hypothetical protein
MTALADLLSPADRKRLLKRLAEWRELADAMRERGGLAPLPPARPLHKMCQRDDSDDHDHERHDHEAGRG